MALNRLRAKSWQQSG